MEEDTQETNVVSADEIKKAFKALCVPTQENFEELVEFCSKGNQVLPAEQGGLTTTTAGNRLSVNPDEDCGLTFSGHALNLKLKAKGGLSAENGMEVLLDAESGLKLDNGIAVREGAGLEVSQQDSKLQLKLAGKSGLEFGGGELRLKLVPDDENKKTGSGLNIIEGKLQIKCGRGLAISTTGFLVLDLAALDQL